MTVPARYRNATAWRQSLNAHIRAQAAETGRSVQAVRRQVAYQRFLARVFAAGDGGWILKGGVGLLMRTPVARATTDVDLIHEQRSTEHAVADLQAAAAHELADGLEFRLGRPVPLSGAGGLTISVEATISTTATVFERFSVDVVTDRAIPAAIEHSTPTPVVEGLAELADLPPFALYPLPAQIADKTCATFSQYGAEGRPSTRVRDLVDIVIIATTQTVDADTLSKAVASEATRRGVHLPGQFDLPDQRWRQGYRREASTASLPPELVDVDGAVALAQAFLGPTLAGAAQPGWWDPDTRQWSRESATDDH